MPRPVVDVARELLSTQTLGEGNILLTELIEAIEQCPPARHFDPVTTIESLLTYLAPHGTHYCNTVAYESPADVFLTQLAGATVTALASVMRRYRSTTLWPTILQRLIWCWPSTCIALRLYYRFFLRESLPADILEIDSAAQTFTGIVTLLHMYAHVDALATLVRNTPEAVDLVIKLWGLQVRDSRLSTQLEEMLPNIYPPSAAGLLNTYLFTPNDPEISGSILISALESSLRHTEIASVVLEHLRRSISALSQYSESSAVYIAHNMHANLLNLSCMHSGPLHFILLSQNSVSIVTEALLAVTSRPLSSASAEAIADCTTQICQYLDKYIASDGIANLNHCLELGLLVGLRNAHPWMDVKRAAFDACIPLLAVHLPRYLIYISILRRLPYFFLHHPLAKGMPSNIREVWLAFENYAQTRIMLASVAELRVEPCNNSQCSQPPSFQCTGCLQAVYCSKACQTAAWNTHGSLCQARTSARLNGIPPDLAEEDVQFALRVARHDFEEHKAQICARWSAAGTLPIRAGIDYSVFPHKARTDTPRVVGEQVASEALIYAMFPQGTAGTEYYMCDLGLTRESGATDDEAIAAVVQMVSAQPVPAFVRIN